MLSLDQYLGHIALGGAFNFGHAGVDFFFVLSGFIIFYVNGPDIGRSSSLPTYAWRRVTRIYPNYWVITAILWLMIAVLGGSSRDLAKNVGYLLNSLLLIPMNRDPLLGVAWTLEHEMLFYILFATLIFNRLFGVIVFVAWIIVIVAVQLNGSNVMAIRFIGASYHLQFFMGIAAALLVYRFRIPCPRILISIGGLLFFLAGVAENTGAFAWAGFASNLIFGILAMVIVVGLASGEQHDRLRVPAPLVFLGAASYSLYLVHIVAFSVLLKVLSIGGIVRLLPEWLCVSMMVGAAVIGGITMHYASERPLMRWCRRFNPFRTKVLPDVAL